MRTQAGAAPMAVFRGYRSDYGAGLGNVLSGLLRHAVPLVAPAVKNIGKTLISAGANKLQNLIENKLGPHTRPQPQQQHYPAPQPEPYRRRRPVKRRTAGSRRPVKRKRRTKQDIFST